MAMQESHFSCIPKTPAAFVAEQLARRPFAFGSFALVLAAAAATAVGVQYGMKLLVDAMAVPGAAPDEVAGRANAVFNALLLFLALIAIESVLWRVGGVIGSRTIIAAGVDIRTRLFGYLTGHSMRFFSHNLSGALGQRVTATAGNFGAMTSTVAWQILPPCIDFVGALIIFGSIEPMMAVALAGAVLLIGGVVSWYGARGRPLHHSYAEKANWAGGELVDAVVTIWPVKAFAARRRELARLSGVFGNEAAAQQRSWFHLEKVRMAHDLGLLVLAGAMLAWAIALWNQGRVTPGDVVVISALTFRILHGSRDLAMAATGMVNNIAFLRETLATIGQDHDVADAPDARPLQRQGGTITLDKVGFGYNAEARVFENFTLHIPAGQHIGLVGPSGSGKSTLIALIQRLYDADSGSIGIDGQDVKHMTQDSLRAAIAVVPQDCVLFHRSLMENIRYARPEASEDEVIAASRAASCHDFIMAMPQGYDTMVGERGMHLSGGQRQRIAIARAILADTQIVLLDEATSALDSISEQEVQRALDQLLRDRTVIIAAHRLATLAACDRVVVLDKGRIAEDGPPDHLLQQQGVFRELWERQSIRQPMGPDISNAAE